MTAVLNDEMTNAELARYLQALLDLARHTEEFIAGHENPEDGVRWLMRYAVKVMTLWPVAPGVLGVGTIIDDPDGARGADGTPVMAVFMCASEAESDELKRCYGRIAPSSRIRRAA